MKVELAGSGGGHRFRALDSLRGLAACIVVCFHMPSSGHVWGWRLVQHGFLAVDLFFVLSGFVISASYGRRLAQGFPPLRFLLLRLGRVYPLHLFVLGLFVAWELARLTFALPGFRYDGPFTGESDPSGLMPHLLLVQSWTGGETWNKPSWSIGAEYWTYVAFAIGVLAIGWRARLLPLALLLMVPASIVRLGYLAIPHGLSDAIGCAFSFGGGMIAHMIWVAAESDGRVRAIGRWPATAIELATAALVLVLAMLFGGKLSPAMTPAFVLAVTVFSFEQGLISRALRSAPLLLVGELSYSIYMIHYFLQLRLLDAITVLGRSPSFPFEALQAGRLVVAGNVWACDALTAGMLVLVIALAWPTFHFIENPARRWSRERLTPRPAPGRGVQPTTGAV